MPKKEKTKKPKKVIKQKQKQQISIVINSNNRNKRTTVPRQAPPPPHQPPRNNPPVVNIMGDSRPQVNPSGNFSGIGQQNRIFANDSALEQRLARLLKFENDQSANPAPALSNTKILAPAQPPRAKSPVPVKLKAPPSNSVMDLNFFNTKRKAYEEAQALKGLGDDEEENKTPSVIELFKGKIKNIFSPNNNAIPSVGATITPRQNMLDEVSNLGLSTPRANLLDDMEQEGEEEKDNEMYEPLQKPPFDISDKQHKAWFRQKKPYKVDWMLDNRGEQGGLIHEDEDTIDNMKVAELNQLYQNAMVERHNF